MSDKDKVVSEDEQDISQEQEALQIEKTVTPLSSPVRELTPDSPILPQYGSQPPPVLRRLHTGFRNMAQLPKRKAPSYQELEANRERFKKVLLKNKILSEKDAKNPQEGKRLFAFKHTNPKSRDKLEQEKMLLQDMRAEQNLSASELRQIDLSIYMIEQEIKNLAEDLCAGPVSKSQKREGPSGDRDPGAGICSITVRRHICTVLCKSETFVGAERIPNNEIVGLAGLVVSSFLVGYFLINFISRFDIDTIFRVMDFLEEDIMAEKELPKLNL